MVVVPLREDFDAAQVRAHASRCDDGNQARRLLSIAAVYDGMSRRDAARLGGMDRQTLRDWVHRFNGEGPEGLLDRKAPGAPAKLTASQLEVLAGVVERGPDPVSDGIVRWRRMDLKAWIEGQFGVVYHERSVSRLLAQLGFSHISARPRHPGQDAAVMEDFKKTFPARWRRR